MASTVELLELFKKDSARKTVTKEHNGSKVTYDVYKVFVYSEDKEYEGRKYTDYTTIVEGEKFPVRLSTTRKSNYQLSPNTLVVWVRVDKLEGYEQMCPNNFESVARTSANGKMYFNKRLWINRVEEFEEITQHEELPF